jgi:glycosyltransferase involved in cell wall biosynthesis
LRSLGVETEILSFADDLGAEYGENEFKMGWVRKAGYNLAAFRRLIKESKGNIFFLQRLNYHAPAVLLAGLLRRNKLIFDCDDWNIRENPKYYFGFFPSSKMEYATRKVARHADACIASSRFLEGYLGRFNKRTYYLPTGVDTGLFSPRPETDPSKVVFSWIGTVYHPEMRDNLSFILSCFSELAGEFDNVFLYLAGEGKYYDELKNRAAGYKFAGRIKFYPWIHPEGIPQHLAGINIGLLPLTQDSYFNRAKSPTKLFEYMAMGKAVICSKTGEAEEVIEDGKTGLLASDRKDFIAKMRSLVLDVEFREGIGYKAANQVEEKYSLGVLGRELYSIIKAI